MSKRAASSPMSNGDSVKRTKTALEHSGELVPEAHGKHDLAFDNEFSRLIGAIGKEALLRLHTSKVLLSGLKGLGVEIAKNLVLMGVRSLSLHDPEPVTIADLSSNFFLTEADIGQPRDKSVIAKLQELHERVQLNVVASDLTEDVLKEYQVVVITNAKSEAELLRISTFCHQNNIRFVAADTFGLYGQVFVDFGNEWQIQDPTGEESKTCFAESITQDVVGLVTVAHGERHDFEDGDCVRITEVKGMTELNDRIFTVTVKSPFSFTIGDTSSFQPYISGGYFEQVKVPKTVSHEPLSGFFSGGKFPMGKILLDFAKFEQTPHYTLFAQAILKFREAHGGKLPRPWNEEDAEEIIDLAKKINDSRSEDKVYNVDEKLLKLLAKTASGDLSPVATVLGGVVAQEVIKGTAAKYTPIDQWYFFESLEALPLESLPSEEDCEPKGTRYDGQIAVFGRKFQEKIENLRYFLVGAGAIGCEVLKCWAMMGVGTGPSGKIDVTDMDQIEISNLNRQFLYRSWDVSKFKSQVAAAAAQKMNTNMKIFANTLRVGPETESTFNDSFWNSLSGVCNALDNVQARLYVDSKCVFYGKSLLESGTLGTKGNTQVIVPFLTESYGSSRDPPSKETPMCTLHFFPHTIQHCLQWAREDLFEGTFAQNPDLINQFIEKPNFKSTITPQQKKLTYEKLHAILVSEKPATFEDCIKWARIEFEVQYNHRVKQLLHNFPEDFVDQNGIPFWSGTKRPPHPIEFDVNNQVHLDFIVAATFLRAYTYGIIPSEFKPIDFEEQIEKIKKFVVTVQPPPFVAKKVKIPTPGEESSNSSARVESLEVEDDEALIKKYEEELPTPESFGEWRAKAVSFEKDDDNNFHIDFITAASNLRALAYSIPTADRLKSKLIAGKIVPAIVTTTAVVTGLAQLEFYKLHSFDKKPIEHYRNTYVNLALPLFQQSEPIAPAKRTFSAQNRDFTLWDRIEIKEGDITLQQFLDWFKEKQGMDLDMVSAGSAMIYNKYTKDKSAARLPRRLSELVQELTKTAFPPTQNYFSVEVVGSDVNGDDVDDMPDVFFFFK